ncbi:MAG: FAD-dependent oxidoreductase [Hyphomicrobiaceae bacterium]|nr:FAD-dependent oxidoreductase [Hyphomicrobiaceae bacterium]
MSRPSRRDFARLAGAAGAGAATAPLLGPFAIAQAELKVVVVGGGAGGATVAHYLKIGAPEIDVTLIEANPIYSSSFFSNPYLGGLRTLESLNHSYAGLRRLYVWVVNDIATDVNPARKTVRTRGGRTYTYDRLVLSPGIDIKYDAIAGYSPDAAARAMPHAYTTNAAQKRLLRHQLLQMHDGGTVAMVMPASPYRCPSAPYERACMIAHYLKTRKPRSKLVILDPKKEFSEQALFEEAFSRYYKGIIELNLSNEVDDFAVASLNPATREILTKAGKRVRADVANVIPPQRAGEIAAHAGCTDGDWCPIHPESFMSRNVPDVYVLGDAAVAADMPKSAFSANSQAKVVATDIIAALNNTDRSEPHYRDACWSLVAPDDSVKFSADYAPGGGKLVASNAFVSQPGEPADLRRQNYQDSVAWYASITADMFAKHARAPGPADAGRPSAPAEH